MAALAPSVVSYALLYYILLGFNGVVRSNKQISFSKTEIRLTKLHSKLADSYSTLVQFLVEFLRRLYKFVVTVCIRQCTG